MKKILDQLELHVQWLALLLGIVFALYMAYAYLLVPPVKVEVASQQLEPGTVDDYIMEHAGNELDAKIKQPVVPKMESPDLLSLFTKEINYGDKPLPDSALAVAFPPTKDAPSDASGTGTKIVNGVPITRPGVPSNETVTGLPTLMAAKINGFRSGMSNVTPMADPGVAAVPIDKTWVTVRGDIDINPIVQAFAAVKIQAGGPAGKTSFIQLAMEREEKIADGSWSNHTVVPHIKTSEVQPMPAATAPVGDLWSYLQWAEGHTVDLMQPNFYPVLKGDPWAVPGEQVMANNQPPAAAFDPAQYIDATPQKLDEAHLTLDQKRLVSQARANKAKETARSRGTRSAPSRGPSGGAASPDNAPRDMARPHVSDEPEEQQTPGAAMSGTSQQPSSAQFPLPTGPFDPADWVKANPTKSTATVWAHDETAVPGHTYRYRLTYTIRNPIFKGINVAKDPKLTDVFDITAPASEWTDGVEIIPTVNFWIARAPHTVGGSVDMQVFRWQAGSTVSKQFSVSPGDMIGQADGQTDFTTGWTLVDVMTDPFTRQLYVLVIDPNGVIHKREWLADSNDPKLKSWRDQASVAVAPAAGPSPTR